MGFRYFLVDAFACQVFAGNPAAVCLLHSSRDASWMQCIAAEINAPATAFVRPIEMGYAIRWFTPSTELGLCGHATLAASHILQEEGIATKDLPITYESASGPLICHTEGEFIELDFPSKPIEPSLVEEGVVLDALSVKHAGFVGRTQFDVFVQLDDENSVRQLTPDFARLEEYPTRGFIVTSAGTGGFDFVSRFFAPRIGIREDHVTGSAHCSLAGFWSPRLKKKRMRAFQASPRGGELLVTDEGDRVRIAGKAITVVRGRLFC